MVSMAILMAAGSEKTTVHPGSPDLSSNQGESEDISFAKSFNERVESTALLQGKSTADEAAIVPPDLKSAPAKKLDEVADLPNTVKGKVIMAEEIPARIGLKNVFADKIGQRQAIVVSGTQEKTATGGPAAKEIEAPTQVEEAADDVSSSSPTSYATPAVAAPADGLVSQVNHVGGDRPVVSSRELVMAPKDIETGATTTESYSAKKTARTQENVAAAKAGLKAGVGVNANTVETKPVVDNSAAGAIPVTGQVVVSSVAVQRETGKVTEVFSKAVPGMAKTFSGVSPAFTSGSVHQEAASGKTNVVGTAIPENTAPDPGAPSEASVAPGKMAAVTPLMSGDGENRSPSMPEPITAMPHSMTGGSAVLDSAPIAVASGNIPEALTTTTPPIVHPTSLQIGAREQDVPGFVAPTINGAPRLLTTTPTALEVGIQSGTHGWLKVRAEMTDAGVVNASVSPSSSAGQEMLHRELPALTAYLQGEKVAVNAIVVHAPLAAGGESRSSGAGMDSHGGETPQRNDERGDQQRYTSATNSDAIDATTNQSVHGVDEDGSLPLATYAIGGGWLSVRA